jgi:hypothetical protein
MPAIAENLEALAQKANNIVTATSAIKEAITTKGGIVSSGDKLDDLPADIATIPNSYTQEDEGKVVSNGELVAQTSATYTENGTYDTTTKNSVTVDVASSSGVTLGVGRAHTCIQMFNNTWTTKTWNGFSDINGSGIWTDGVNIYYSESSNQYVLDKATSTWTTKTWNGFSDINGSGIWTDGDNVYYSYDSNQYVLNKSTSTWTSKTWSGLTSFGGLYIWTDGENIYYSNGLVNQYVLNKSTSTWSKKVWSDLTPIFGSNIWTDGENIYYSYGSNQYVLVKSPYITRSVPSARPTKAITAT